MAKFGALAPERFFPCENGAMFTGIITGVGHITSVQALGESAEHGKRLSIATPSAYLDDVELGDSIALNGACMTVVALERSPACFSVEISAESLARTAGLSEPGRINLEKALRASDRLGGHLVSGHVDGIGHVSAFSAVGESWALRVLAPRALAKYLAYKGSIAINGVSLTVNQVKDTEEACEVSINLIAHTINNTALGTLCAGSRVNLEIDLIARYCERMLNPDSAQTTARSQ